MNQSLFALLVLFMTLASLPQRFVERMRLGTVSLLREVPRSSGDELKRLQLENKQLQSQLDLAYQWLNSEKRFGEQMAQWQTLFRGGQPSTERLKRRLEEQRALLQREVSSVFGRIIYRDPSSWSSSCWIDVGYECNSALNQTIVAKNSPVVSGSALIGVVEYVGKRQSRVRLITDAGLKTAVRAIRGSCLDREIASLSRALLDALQRAPGQEALVSQLAQFVRAQPIRWEDGYFAKGEIFGSSAPHFRALKARLTGVGFNCDFPDREGASQDLHNSILQEGDLLVTSGLDGVFPPGLKVGLVALVKPLSAGAFAYEIEAIPAARDLADLTAVHVLPPVATD